MGKEQDLLQAVKSGDLLSTQKLLSKLRNNRNSKYLPICSGALLLEDDENELYIHFLALYCQLCFLEAPRIKK